MKRLRAVRFAVVPLVLLLLGGWMPVSIQAATPPSSVTCGSHVCAPSQAAHATWLAERAARRASAPTKKEGTGAKTGTHVRLGGKLPLKAKPATTKLPAKIKCTLVHGVLVPPKGVPVKDCPLPKGVKGGAPGKATKGGKSGNCAKYQSFVRWVQQLESEAYTVLSPGAH
jgi:hypothetical protein